jgi:hypothetical protein
MRRENFVEKFSVVLGFLSGVIAFLSGLIMTMTWLHFAVPLGLNVDVSSFLLMLSFTILAGTSIVAFSGTQEWPPKNEWYLMTHIHFEYHEVHRHEGIPDSHWDIFRDSHWTPNRLICQLQIQGSRDQGIMIQQIIDYLWYDVHACSMISKSLIKLLGANQTRDGWNTWVIHLIRKIIKDNSIVR